MFMSIIIWILISVLFLFLAHNLFLYFKENLTIPKVKDLVDRPHQQYKDILNTIQTKEKKDLIQIFTKNNGKLAKTVCREIAKSKSQQIP